MSRVPIPFTVPLQILTSVWNATTIVTTMPGAPIPSGDTHVNAIRDTRATELIA